MSIFDYLDYRQYLKARFASFPKKGRGKSQELANHLRVHPTVVSQVFSGLRDFTSEQVVEVCEFLELSALESRYFRLLVSWASAGTHKLKAVIKAEITEVKSAAQALSARVATTRSLSETERAIFYSSWLYSACRLFCSVSENGKTLDEISTRFSIARVRTVEIMDFLLKVGLCLEKKGRYVMGPQSTFVEQGSPFLLKHQTNWRLKAIQGADSLSKEELMFTGPMSISQKDFALLREKMAGFIKEFAEVVKNSPAEELACFNMDFFWIRK